MHHLEGSTQDSAAQVGLLDPEATSEAVNPGGDYTGVRDESALVLLVGDDLGELDLDVLGILGLSTEPAEGIGGIVESSALDEVTGGVREEDQTTAEDKTPGELDADGDTVGAGIVAVLSSVGNAGGEQETDGDAELVSGDKGATDLSGALDFQITLINGSLCFPSPRFRS